MLTWNHPLRRRSRWRHPQDFSSRHTGFETGLPGDILMPMSNAAMLPISVRGSLHGASQDFEDTRGIPLPRSILSDPIAYGGRFPYEGQATTFESTAYKLKCTIGAAMKFCREVEHQFKQEIYTISSWLDISCIDDLWAMKLDFNGVPASERARNPEAQAAATTITYNVVVGDLHRAVNEFKLSCWSCVPSSQDLDMAQSPERTRSTLKKLLVTLEGIEELVQSVRSYRERMNALLRELFSAQELLHDIREPWVGRQDSERR